MSTLSDEELLELTGEEALEDVTSLFLRSRSLTSIEDIPARLPNLVTLSLSHNVLSNTMCLSNLSALEHLNIGFNALTSVQVTTQVRKNNMFMHAILLKPMEEHSLHRSIARSLPTHLHLARASLFQGLSACTSLKNLYLSNNRIRDIAPFETLTRLEVLSLFRNDLASLDFALAVLSHLPSLRDLDLDANPCSRVDDYRPRVLAALPSLAKLDSEPVNHADHALIRDLPLDLRASAQLQLPRPSSARPSAGGSVGYARPSSVASSSEGGALDAGPGGRPLTAPSRSPSKAFQRPGTAQPTGRTSLALAAPSPQRLFQDEYLDRNPILLGYLAESALAAAPERPPDPAPSARSSQRSSAGMCDDEGTATTTTITGGGGGPPRRPSFADRLRTTAATLNATSKGSPSPGMPMSTSTSFAAGAPPRPSTAAPGGRPPLSKALSSSSNGFAAAAASALRGEEAASATGGVSREAVERSLVAGSSPMEMVR